MVYRGHSNSFPENQHDYAQDEGKSEPLSFGILGLLTCFRCLRMCPLASMFFCFFRYLFLLLVVSWMVAKSVCAAFKPWLEPLLVGITGNHQTPGFLWCEMDFVYPQYGFLDFPISTWGWRPGSSQARGYAAGFRLLNSCLTD